MPYYTRNHMHYDSAYIHLYRKPNHLILHTHNDVLFQLLITYFHLIYIYTHMIHAELKILFYLPLTLNTCYIHIFLFWTKTRVYIWSIVLQLTPRLLTLNSIWIKRGSLELTLTSVGLAWHGRLFKRSTFCRSFRIWA